MHTKPNKYDNNKKMHHYSNMIVLNHSAYNKISQSQTLESS